MATAIKVENLSKAYQLGDFGTGTISRDLERYWARLKGKEDPFLKIGETNDRTTKGNSDVVWSLKDLDFDIEQGSAVGIIGRNGAGKSTLLKILSRVTSPTTGSVKVKGRIASLLEVGTGFHPELTGRENIFLNGAILGMRKAEIKRKFDEIVDFSGVERYIDTPVKRYSSGMYVRLAFAVAAHLESETLIVDEVLAVGDSEFQKKCLGKMGQVSKGEGRTVLFVSHNMGSIAQLCNKGILLNNGNLLLQGNINECVKAYTYTESKKIKNYFEGDGLIKQATAYTIFDKSSARTKILLEVTLSSACVIQDMVLGFMIKDLSDTPIIALNNRHYENYASSFRNITQGKFLITISDAPLLEGKYKIDIFLGDRLADLEVISDALLLDITERYEQQTAFAIDSKLNKLYINNISWESI
ncbi:ABC transporter ATP-binding protein [Mucilaginibacter sp. SP1R1]|uniref:ABC transporter ATP-binding protein n=1 Tax=Mucilaginibacter sp. SP1R1 TaxID=2723091 RepID=UPI00161C9696|nr:ABC transporter ATP-binding protein [Mucilaginibacter sp. SP1R1]MBB6151003.1 lipopolysaccharide transport system ATP-binding protein [Mucilaginibacter sp. SP1R1]